MPPPGPLYQSESLERLAARLQPEELRLVKSSKVKAEPGSVRCVLLRRCEVMTKSRLPGPFRSAQRGGEAVGRRPDNNWRAGLAVRGVV
jgi:hypothetical protein